MKDYDFKLTIEDFVKKINNSKEMIINENETITYNGKIYIYHTDNINRITYFKEKA